MRLGLQVPSFTWPAGPAGIASTLADIGGAAEQAGFASLWVMDHFFQIQNVGKPEEPMLEAYTALGYLAGVTRRIRLGTMVTGVIYRHPGILVKSVSTLDVISGGRAYFGIGAAWNEQESKGLGVPFPPVKERFERLEETLQIAKQMWSGMVAPFNGKHYQLAQTLNSPQPLTKPHPPILIGGMGEKKTLRFVARYADACNLFARMGVEIVKQKLDVLKRHCEAEGRAYEEIERTALSTVRLGAGGQTPKEVIAFCRQLADIGVQHFIFSMPDVQDIKPLEIIGREVIPAVAGF